MKGQIFIACIFGTVTLYSAGVHSKHDATIPNAEAHEDSHEHKSCEAALEHSGIELKKAATTVATMTNALVGAGRRITRLEDDLNLVAYGTRTSYDAESDKYEAVMCEHKSTQISCPCGKKIKIEYADYGRHDHHTCIHTEIYTTNCSSNKTMPYISNKCNSATTCRISANHLIFGDPCVYTHKYLKVIFKCE